MNNSQLIFPFSTTFTCLDKYFSSNLLPSICNLQCFQGWKPNAVKAIDFHFCINLPFILPLESNAFQFVVKEGLNTRFSSQNK